MRIKCTCCVFRVLGILGSISEEFRILQTILCLLIAS